MSNIQETLKELERLKESSSFALGHMWLFKEKPEEVVPFHKGFFKCVEHIEEFIKNLEDKK